MTARIWILRCWDLKRILQHCQNSNKWLGVTDLVEMSERIVVAELNSSMHPVLAILNVLRVVELLKGDSLWDYIGNLKAALN